VHNGVQAPAPDPIFDPVDITAVPQHTTKIVMTSPERPPITGLVEISVEFDVTRTRGVAVHIDGALGADLKPEAMEEVCRRGGALGLPGRAWAKSHVFV
jgi:hypothetical protein